MLLTKHQRHDIVLQSVRKWYQEHYYGSRLFPNRSGFGWVGKAVKDKNCIKVYSAQAVSFGIPGKKEGYGGTDLIGWTIVNDLPVFTAIEIKTGKDVLKKNQVNFKNMIENINGIYFLARECPNCKGEGCKECFFKGWEFE